MILCLDSGNTRLKWGFHDGQDWTECGAIQQGDWSALAALPGAHPCPECIVVANVAGAQALAAIRQALAPWAHCLEVVKSQARQAGVTNLYESPEKLGVDRWCALIGARSLTTASCLVVMLGTASTIDFLSDEGCFMGGLILPGMEVMRRSLAQGTANLPLAEGVHRDFPRSTSDAIVSGILEAQLGAIERAYQRLPPGRSSKKMCIVSGGNAFSIVPMLAIPYSLTENLPLLGLRVIAAEILQT